MASKRITITISEQKVKELEELAQARGVSKSVLVMMAIEELKKGGQADGQ